MSKEYGPLYGEIITRNNDGQTRITRGKDFFLSGGTQDHHEIAREVFIKTEERLKQDGKNFRSVGLREIKERLIEQNEKIRR